MNIAFIPLRCGSKSIPFKNIKNFCGKPLVYWNLKSLEESVSIDKVYVATDCLEIKSVLEEFNFSKVIIYDRDKANADDKATTESVMIEFLEKSTFNDNDVFFLVQATSPFTQSIDFDNAYVKYNEENADSLLTCVKSKRFCWNDNATPINYDYNSRPRRQDFDGIYMENGAFYISSIRNIKKYKNRLSGKIVIYEMKEFTSLEIDEEDDWIIAEKLMNKYIIKDKPTFRIKLFLTDVDGTLTDAGMYYGENGEEFKKFNTHDGKGFELLRNAGIRTGILTSENTKIVKNRAKKLKVDFLYQGITNLSKLECAKDICEKLDISLDEVAYIGDDINCKELLEKVGYAACPSNALNEVKQIKNIINLNKKGGEGAVREFIDFLLDKQK